MAPMDLDIELQVIGVVRTAHTDRETTPIQAGLNRAELGTIEVEPAYADGLDGLAGFDYAWLLTWLHGHGDSDDPPPLRQVPFLLRAEQRQVGILATRGPRRINPIGLSLIRLVQVSGATVTFGGVDVIDGTLVIDVKPYVTRFDRPSDEPRCGWFDHVALGDGLTPAALATPPPAPPPP